ncbi:poly(A) polymerase/tRNA nucleotidyltransferase family protein [Crocosphaera subtropica ATCC 51142]|uniref:Poly(A) polymerase/tRNA nucleotidyltransferase family protein n=1 Tax=Crocosphaera subtropica (strain ATCC 51142 / BH68) TaxID=43989 RepID=B1WSH6_CROS5|nr:CBS domain-containing protein [Crocosphaera subtropica]ACB53555.1 poly(A) polymerase/tRNA nucleotidyltransferase family protein [Crocosphaera subtropica ATCC 51142]
MDLILCHQTVDFDALGAAVGLSCLKVGSRIVLTGGAHPTVKDFLALHRDEIPLIELRSVNPKQIRHLIVVDNQQLNRLGKASDWFSLSQIKSVELYDHHLNNKCDIPTTFQQIEPVGATTTLIVEKIQEANIIPNPIEATIMALGIHVDTGSLTFSQSTARDAKALAWLMEIGANVKIVAEYCDPGFTPQLQGIFSEALDKFETKNIRGYQIAWVLIETENFVSGLSNLAERLIELTESDALLFAHSYHKRHNDKPYPQNRLIIIGRTRIEGTNLNELFSVYGGGGHSQAASLMLRDVDPENKLQQLVEEFITQIPHPLTARDLMSSPVRTIRPETTIEQAQRMLFRYGHSGLSVVDENDHLVGVISRRDLDLALHHGFSHAPVKGYMSKNLKTIHPDTLLPDIESIMVTYDVGRLPVINDDKLIGIVTRTDLLRQIHQQRKEVKDENGKKVATVSCLLPSIRNSLEPSIWKLLEEIAQEAEHKGWHLYIVGGAVRDLLLTRNYEKVLLQDIDLVVDGFHRSADVGAGVELASTIQKKYSNCRLSVHGEFQTAALLWHKDPEFGSLWLDIATSRTEFYPYPAANPEVEASSIRQDLYRRDFTINALAVRLTPPREGELLDFFGGLLDLKAKEVRVLHANSFIEDPTRIYRAVRFAVRLKFEIEPQTEAYIRYAIESGIYEKLRLKNHVAPALTTRLKAELKYILEANYWKPALQLLSELDALKCLHNQVSLDDKIWWQIRCASRWLKYLDPDNKIGHWLIRLEILISQINIKERKQLAQNLQLPKESLERIEIVNTLSSEIQENLKKYDKTSEKYKQLYRYKLPDLMLVAVNCNKKIRRIIWQYLTQWSKVESPLNGNDLKRMGYKPGPKYKMVLDRLLSLTLDGEIQSKEEAEIIVREMMKELN